MSVLFIGTGANITMPGVHMNLIDMVNRQKSWESLMRRKKKLDKDILKFTSGESLIDFEKNMKAALKRKQTNNLKSIVGIDTKKKKTGKKK